MFLVTAATRFELAAFSRCCPTSSRWTGLCTGVGPVETAMQLTAFLTTCAQPVCGVVNMGVGGAYFREDGGAGLGDLCVAEREILGDLGVCTGEQITPLLGENLDIHDSFALDSPFARKVCALLTAAGYVFHLGTFVTVNCVSGTRKRGDALQKQHQALCENMEGAAAARVCHHFQLPLVELRCISNKVEDRNIKNWCLQEACDRCGQAVAQVMKGLIHD